MKEATLSISSGPLTRLLSSLAYEIDCVVCFNEEDREFWLISNEDSFSEGSSRGVIVHRCSSFLEMYIYVTDVIRQIKLASITL